MKLVIEKVKIKLLLLFVVYYFLFQILYQNWISNVWGYEGYVNQFSLMKFCFSIILLSILVIAAPINASPSTSIVGVAICTIFIPSLVLFAGGDARFDFPIITFFAILIIIFVTKTVRLNVIKIPKIQNNHLMICLLMLSIFDTFGIVYFGGLGNLNFDFSRVYELRRDVALNIPGIFGYINPAVSKVVVPFGIVLSYVYRRWFYLLVFCGISVFIFGLTQHKAPVFFPLAILLILTFWNHQGKSFRLPIFFIIVVLLGMLDMTWYVGDFGGGWSGWYSALIPNRALLLPSWLNLMYIDFFSINEWYYWANSKISMGLVSSPYDFSMENLIGFEVFGNSDTSANAGWVGSGFANAGIFGVIIYSIFIGLFFAFLDAYGKKLGDTFVFALFSILGLVMLTSTDLTNMFLTHGLLVAMFFLVILNAPTSETERN